ncbi:type VI secretion system-associated FHA domain protein TagH [Aurantivibrio plasticivorans]
MKLELQVSHLQNSGSNFKQTKVFSKAGGILGREPSCDLFLPCPEKAISRQHAKVFVESDAFYIEDMSANGVFINNQSDPLGQGNTHKVVDGDHIRIGDFSIELSIAENSEVQARAVNESPATERTQKMKPATSNLTKQSHSKVTHLHTKRKSSLTDVFLDDGNNPFGGPPSIEKVKIDIGDTSDSFKPPQSFIPDNWDLDIETTPAEPTSPPVPPIQQPLQTTAQDRPLSFSNDKAMVSKLLQGLGCDDVSSDELTPETMLLLGQTLRVTLNGLVNNRKFVQETKCSLSLDEISLERQAEADGFEGLENGNQLAKMLLDNHSSGQKQLPARIALTYKYLMEDQRDIVAGIHYATEKLKEGLSPTAIEEAYQQSQGKPSNEGFSGLSEKLTGNAKKWAFYRSHWSRICNGLNTAIRKQFEYKFLLSHAKRTRDRIDG